MPDGSKVWLNASTSLVYKNSLWSTKREVDLSGEAYFEVAKNKYLPFIVSSKKINTRVLGTKFNVRARAEEHRVVTTLLQGSVQMESPIAPEGRILKPGQSMTIDTHTYQAELVEYSSPNDILTWIDGRQPEYTVVYHFAYGEALRREVRIRRFITPQRAVYG